MSKFAKIAIPSTFGKYDDFYPQNSGKTLDWYYILDKQKMIFTKFHE